MTNGIYNCVLIIFGNDFCCMFWMLHIIVYVCCFHGILAGIFPEPDKDAVIQIANMVIRQGEKDPFIRNVFTWKSCAPIVGAEVLSFDTEQELLRVGQLVSCLA